MDIGRLEYGTAGNTDISLESKCALCFFGLPRSYAALVLPSIVENVLKPNRRYGCDVFVHSYIVTEEHSDVANNRGGALDPSEVLRLEGAAANLGMSVYFDNDTEAQFMEARKTEYDRYHNTTDRKGNLAYYPWKSAVWELSNLGNVVRQWHSIDAVFQLMEQHADRNNIKYTQVGMLRNDVVFLTPIDIMRGNDELLDAGSREFFIPKFASYPVNDRMVYGPFDAVKIWATKRFKLIEKRVKLKRAAGWVMLSERFIAESIIPAMNRAGYVKRLDPSVCFLRTRLGSVVMLNDCNFGHKSKGIPTNAAKVKSMVESIVQRKCTMQNYADKLRKPIRKSTMPSSTKTPAGTICKRHDWTIYWRSSGDVSLGISTYECWCE
eukprot:scaffold11212_cov121-Cylindrotheca_fusiformis.AAC.8